MGLCRPRLRRQRLARRQNPGKVLAHCRTDLHGPRRVHLVYGHRTKGSSIRRSLPPGRLLRRIYRLLLVDFIYIYSAACEESSRHSRH